VSNSYKTHSSYPYLSNRSLCINCTILFSIFAIGKLGNFKKYKSDELDLLGQPYNYNSIMHYGANVFAKDPNKPTLTPLRHGAKIGQRKKLSLRDIKEIQLLYGCIQSGHHSE